MCCVTTRRGLRSPAGLRPARSSSPRACKLCTRARKCGCSGWSRDMGFNLSEWALNNRSLTVYLMIVAVVAGLFAFVRLGRNEDPSFVIKTMVVQAAWPGASVDETVKQVTERLGRTLQETPKVDFLRSFTAGAVATNFFGRKDK